MDEAFFTSSIPQIKPVILCIKGTAMIQRARRTCALQAPFVTSLINSHITSTEPERACYGPKHVAERMAVQTLLITDELFRSSDVATRKRYVNLVDSVKASGGTVLIFSSIHVLGEQLTQLTGIAAILRFPLPDLDDIEM